MHYHHCCWLWRLLLLLKKIIYIYSELFYISTCIEMKIVCCTFEALKCESTMNETTCGLINTWISIQYFNHDMQRQVFRQMFWLTNHFEGKFNKTERREWTGRAGLVEEWMPFFQKLLLVSCTKRHQLCQSGRIRARYLGGNAILTCVIFMSMLLLPRCANMRRCQEGDNRQYNSNNSG